MPVCLWRGYLEDTWCDAASVYMSILQGHCDAFLMTSCTNSPLSVSQSWWLRLFSSLSSLTLGLVERVRKRAGNLQGAIYVAVLKCSEVRGIKQQRFYNESLKHILPAAELWWNEVTYCSPYLRTVSAQSYYICSILIHLAKLLLKNSSDEICCWKQWDQRMIPIHIPKTDQFRYRINNAFNTIFNNL